MSSALRNRLNKVHAGTPADAPPPPIAIAPTPSATEFPELTYEHLLELVTSGEYRMAAYRIVPDLAARILADFNVHNRNPKPLRVEMYARDMASGRWKSKCGNTISFNVNSELDNGQNRLMACVKAGVPFTTIVVVGNDPDAFDAIDRNSIRTKGDTLSYHGHPYSNVLAAAMNMMIKYERDRFATSPGATEQELIEVLARWPEADAYATFTNDLYKRGGAAQGPMLFCLCLFARQAPQAVAVFIEKMVSGAGLAEDDPILILRESLRARREKAPWGRAPEQQVFTAAIIVKAWNAFREGRGISILRFIDGEKFPAVR